MSCDIIQLPIDGDSVCMRCKSQPPPEETITCGTCVTPWHVSCLSAPPQTLVSTLDWLCPDCSGEIHPVRVSGVDAGYGSVGSELVAKIHAIQADDSLNDAEKAKRKQRLLSGKAVAEDDDEEEEKKKRKGENDVLSAIADNLKCSICMELLDRPVTTPCGHNSCLKCFEKWMGQGNRTCGRCGSIVPVKMARNPHINLSIVSAIRLAKASKSAKSAAAGPSKVYHFIRNEDRPDKAFRTERAKKAGKANAASGKIYVTIPSDHFGPITAVNDPVRNQGLLVGESWEDRQECRQWGVHFPLVSGIAGQSNYGAQSVVLSGGYEDDEDHGEWFLYTGSGGRDLSGNKRTTKVHSSDQNFVRYNEALRLSCKFGYPVRVLRANKNKSSAYAPKGGVRYDGVYRIEKCWRKVGIQGSFKVCRYLFVRCDNEPAPWTSNEHGDRPRPTLPNIPELDMATDLFERKESPSWDFDEGEGSWRWMKPPPASKKSVHVLDPEERKTLRKAINAANSNDVRAKLLKDFNCQICRQVMTRPVTTPCGHNFCKGCVQSKFAGQTLMRERSKGGRTLRAQKNVMKCPCCPTDISDFIQNPQVNIEIMEVIKSLKNNEEDNTKAVDEGEGSGTDPEEEKGEGSGTDPEEEKGEGSGTDPEEEKGEGSGTDPEEETLVVSEEAEQPKKRIKLDTDAAVM